MDGALATTDEDTYGTSRDQNLSGCGREGVETGDTILLEMANTFRGNWVQQEFIRDLQ